MCTAGTPENFQSPQPCPDFRWISVDFCVFRCVSAWFGVFGGFWACISGPHGSFRGFPYFWSGSGPCRLPRPPGGAGVYSSANRGARAHLMCTQGYTCILMHFGVFLRILMYFGTFSCISVHFAVFFDKKLPRGPSGMGQKKKSQHETTIFGRAN